MTGAHRGAPVRVFAFLLRVRATERSGYHNVNDSRAMRPEPSCASARSTTRVPGAYGAEYRPLAEIVPAPLSTDHVTGTPAGAAVNWAVANASTSTLSGVIDTAGIAAGGCDSSARIAFCVGRFHSTSAWLSGCVMWRSSNGRCERLSDTSPSPMPTPSSGTQAGIASSRGEANGFSSSAETRHEKSGAGGKTLLSVPVGHALSPVKFHAYTRT